MIVQEKYHYTRWGHAGFWVLWVLLLLPILLVAVVVGYSSLAAWQSTTPTGAWVMLLPANVVVMAEMAVAGILQWLYWRNSIAPLALCLGTLAAVIVAVVLAPFIGIMSGF